MGSQHVPLWFFLPRAMLAVAWPGWRWARGWRGGRAVLEELLRLHPGSLVGASPAFQGEHPCIPQQSMRAWSIQHPGGSPCPPVEWPAWGQRRSGALAADPPAAAVPVAGVTCHRCHSAPIQPAAAVRGLNTNEAQGAAGWRGAPPRQAARQGPPGTADKVCWEQG